MSPLTYVAFAFGILVMFVFAHLSGRNPKILESQQFKLISRILLVIVASYAIFTILRIQYSRHQSDIAMSNWRDGLQLIKQQDYPTAQKKFEAAVKLEPNNPVYQYALAESKKASKP